MATAPQPVDAAEAPTVQVQHTALDAYMEMPLDREAIWRTLQTQGLAGGNGYQSLAELQELRTVGDLARAMGRARVNEVLSSYAQQGLSVEQHIHSIVAELVIRDATRGNAAVQADQARLRTAHERMVAEMREGTTRIRRTGAAAGGHGAAEADREAPTRRVEPAAGRPAPISPFKPAHK